MAIGKRPDTTFIRSLKYDATEGRFSIVVPTVRDGQPDNETRDITADFMVAIDLKNAEAAWVIFQKDAAGKTQPPAFVGSVPVDQNLGRRPSKKHSPAIRVLVKLDDTLGGSIREWMSSAGVVWAAIDALHNEYTKGLVEHPDMVPVIARTGTLPVQNYNGGINYQPTFTIVGWIARPDDLPDMPPSQFLGDGSVPGGDFGGPPPDDTPPVGSEENYIWDLP